MAEPEGETGGCASPRKRLGEKNNSTDNVPFKRKALSNSVATSSQREVVQIAGRIVSIELDNFMCHARLCIDFDTIGNNCFYIGGPNGSGKSALFAALNIGLGGRGNSNDRGNSVKGYIKEGKDKSKIRIVLTNTGQGSHSDYGEFAVVERTITQTASSYTLKAMTGTGRDRKETVISKKKSDLDKLILCYGIQLNNPIFWMSQDRCRQFLAQMKPDKLFEIFMAATGLDYIKECYEVCESVLIDINHFCSNVEKSMNKSVKRFKEMSELRKRVKEIEVLKKQRNEIGWMLLWCPLRDAVKDYDVLNIEMATRDTEENILKHRMLDNRKERENHMAEADKCREKLQLQKDHFKLLIEDATCLEDDLRRLNSDLSKFNNSRRDLLAEDRAMKSELEGMKKKIHDLEDNDKNQERRSAVARMEQISVELENKEASLVERRRQNESFKDDMRQKLDDKDAQLQEARSAAQKCRGDLESRKKDVEVAKASRVDAIARFGEHMPRLLKILHANRNRFEHMPRGPIGHYVRVRDPRWALAIEEALKQTLSSFIFNSRRDLQAFEALLRENGLRNHMPRCITSKFFSTVHDVRANEPPPEWKTIFRMIEVDDPVVLNTLIDNSRIENTVLLEDANTARRIMDGSCHENGAKAYTMAGDTIIGRTASNRGQYRFYAYRGYNRAHLLAEQQNVDIEAVTAEINELEGTYSSLYRQWEQLKDAKARLTQEYSKIDSETEKLQREQRMVRSDFEQNKRRLEAITDVDDSESMLDSLKASMNEYSDRVKDVANKLRLIEKSITSTKSQMSELKENLADKKMEISEFRTEHTEPVEQTLEGVMEKLNKLDAGYERMEKQQKLLVELLRRYEAKQLELDKRKDKAEEESRNSENMPCPEGCSNPPDLSTLPTTADGNSAYDDLTIRIEAAEKANNSGIVITKEMLEEFKSTYEGTRKLFSKVKKMKTDLEHDIKVRQEKYPVVRYAMTIRLKNAFSRLMNIRQYVGRLKVNMERHTIDVFVDTHNKGNDNDLLDEGVEACTKMKMLQDLKGLSGGERSYTTACFIMSLWEIMEAPFRLLDEFDVFMDMVNRKVIMDLLVKMATVQYSHNQFIFFTPQGIKELGDKERVQIFEMPKVRP